MKRYLTLFFVIVIIITNLLTVDAKQSDSTNRFNVVFVTDTSGSMSNTDPQNYRFEAIDLFIGLLANGGNKVGSVVFSNGIIFTTNLTEINNKADKKAISDNIRKQSAKGWTDIGGALLSAVNMIEKDANKTMPSIIVLLTDGNTEMGTEKETLKSLNDKETAMEKARNNDIKIFTISLNTDKSSNTNELKQISQATGGEFREVSNAADLQDVFDVYYRTIYSTERLKLADDTVPESGIISREFTVADVGVEEVNIAIFGKSKDCELVNPNSQTIDKSELDEMIYQANTFYIIKLVDPMPGNWKITIKSEPKSTIKIFKIYNSNLQVVASLNGNQDSYTKGSQIDIVAKLTEDNEIVTDLSRYTNYVATLSVKDHNDNEIFTEEKSGSNISNDGYHFSFIPNNYGTYYASVSVKCDELSSNSEILPINIGNTAPYTISDTIEKHIYRWPFLITTDATIDLSTCAKDAEDENLTYKVKSSSWLEDDYTLKDGQLTINNFSVSKGSFEIAAYDNLGAYCTFNVKITSTNIGLLAAILILGGILLFLIIFTIIIYRLSRKAFMGTIKVENIETGKYEIREPSRGKMMLKSLQVDQTGLSEKAYFQATGKNYIYYVSKKPVFDNYTGRSSKKVRIESNMEIQISSSNDFEKGITVYFESYLNN